MEQAMTVMNSRRGPSPLVIALEQMAFFRNDARAACAESDPDVRYTVDARSSGGIIRRARARRPGW